MQKIRLVTRSFTIITYKANQMLRQGNVNEDGSIESTGHQQVSIPYDKTLFQVEDESGTTLDEITVDEGMVDLLRAVWSHKISTNHSCQGVNDEPAWIRFESFDDVKRFNALVGHLSRRPARVVDKSGKLLKKITIKKWRLNKKCEISFPQEDIAKITEELNKNQ